MKSRVEMKTWVRLLPRTSRRTSLAGGFAGISSAAEFFFVSNVSAEECLSVLGVCACRRWDSSAQIKWECYPQLRDCLPGPLLPVNRCSLDSSRTNVSRQGRVWKYAHMLFKVQQDTSGWYRRMICNSTENIWLYLKAVFYLYFDRNKQPLF